MCSVFKLGKRLLHHKTVEKIASARRAPGKCGSKFYRYLFSCLNLSEKYYFINA